MFNRRSVTAVLLAGAFAAGCSERMLVPPELPDQLTEAESLALLQAMRAVQADTAPTIIGGSENSFVAACPQGGQVSRTLSFADGSVADTVRLTWDLTAAPAGCQVSHEGLRFSVDGAPGVRERGAFVVVGFFESFSIEGSVTGRLDWQLADRSGSCAIDLALSGEPDLSGTEPAVAGVLSGTLCGHETELEVEGIPGPSG